MVIPETGNDEPPTRPTTREATDAKKNVKITTRNAPIKFSFRAGISQIIKAITTAPPITKLPGKSRDVRGSSLLTLKLNPSSDALNELAIVGIARIKETIPPKATAPAPMYRIYLFQISPGSMSVINTVEG